jgi:hypothetical protein
MVGPALPCHRTRPGDAWVRTDIFPGSWVPSWWDKGESNAREDWVAERSAGSPRTRCPGACALARVADSRGLDSRATATGLSRGQSFTFEGRRYSIEAGGENTCPEDRCWDWWREKAKSCLAVTKWERLTAPVWCSCEPLRRVHRSISCLIGATGFEPATTCTPYRCATKLRYARIRA